MKKELETQKPNLTLEDLITDKTEQAIENDSNDLVSLIAINELTNLKKLKVVSRLKPEQVPILTKLYLFADTFKIPFMKSVADNILELQISILGYGRRELVSVVQQSIPEQPIKRGIFERKDVFR